MNIEKMLFEIRDEKFREFNSKLIPNIDKETVIGVKTPELKAIAKELSRLGEADSFLALLPHKYFEENQIHAFLISEMKDFDKALAELERFLPYIDNWATCDQLVLKSGRRNTDSLLARVKPWTDSGRTYTVRFAIGVLMRYFLDERFKSEYLQAVADIKSDEYYVKMMQAWYFATALAKQYEDALTYISERRLDKWVHNKTIQKARESFRVSEEHKRELEKFLIK